MLRMPLASKNAGNNHAGKLDSLKKLREKLEDKSRLEQDNKKVLKGKKKTSDVIKKDREMEKIEVLSDELQDFKEVLDEAELTTKGEEVLSEELQVKKKQIQQLANLFRKNKVLKNPLTIQFVKDMFEELPAKLIDDMYDVYNDVELLKMRYG